MKRLVILGAGTGGTLLANKLRKKLSASQWDITIVDKDPTHYYQPGFLFIPFGIYKREQVIKPKKKFIPQGVNIVIADIEKVDPVRNEVALGNGTKLSYDYLIISTGTEIAPYETPGLAGPEWQKSIFDFYTLEGATRLHEALKDFREGNLVVSIVELPFKCPVAPLEFAFMADSYLRKKNVRDKVNIYYTTPLSGAFTKPKATKMLGELFQEKGIQLIPDFNIERVDNEGKNLFRTTGAKCRLTCSRWCL